MKTEEKVDFIVTTVLVCAAVGVIAPMVLNKLNEGETKTRQVIINTIGVHAGCIATGSLVGTVLKTGIQQKEILDILNKKM